MSFKDKMNTSFMGNRIIKTDEAIGVKFNDVNNAKLLEIDITSLEQNPYQPRLTIDKEKLEELKNSIKSSGMLQPIVVRLKPNSNKFQIIMGHRRFQAMSELGEKYIKAVVVEADEIYMQINSLIENIQREDLDILQEATAYKSIIELQGITQQQLSEYVGKSKVHISKALKLLELPSEILEEIKDKELKISFSILSELSYVTDKDAQIAIFERVKSEKLNREQIRQIISSKSIKKSNSKAVESNHSSGYFIKKRNNFIDIKINLNNLNDKNMLINELQKLIEKLSSE